MTQVPDKEKTDSILVDLSDRYANQYGNGCKQGLLYPIVLTMSGHKQCPDYKFENKEL